MSAADKAREAVGRAALRAVVEASDTIAKAVEDATTEAGAAFAQAAEKSAQEAADGVRQGMPHSVVLEAGEAVGRAAQHAATEAREAIDQALEGAGKEAGEAIAQAVDRVATEAEDGVGGTEPVVAEAAEVVGRVAQQAVENAKEELAKEVRGVASKAGDAIARVATRVAAEAKEALGRAEKEGGEHIGHAMPPAKKTIGESADKAVEEPEDALPQGTEAVLANATEGVRRAAQEAAEEGLKALAKAVERVATNAAETIAEAVEGEAEEPPDEWRRQIKAAEAAVRRAAQRAVKEAEKAIARALQRAMENVGQAAHRAVAAVDEEVVAVVEEAVGHAAQRAVREVVEAVAQAAKSAASEVADTIAEAVEAAAGPEDGVSQGIEALVVRVGEAVGRVAERAVREARETLARALDGMATRAVRAIVSVAQRTAEESEDGVPPGLSEAEETLAKALEGVVTESAEAIGKAAQRAAKEAAEALTKATEMAAKEAEDGLRQRIGAEVAEAEASVARASWAVKEAEEAVAQAVKSAVDSVGQAAQRAVKDAEDAIAKAMERALKEVEDGLRQRVGAEVAEAEASVVRASRRAVNETEKAVERAAKSAVDSVEQAAQTAVRDAEKAVKEAEVGRASRRAVKEAEAAVGRAANSAVNRVGQAARSAVKDAEDAVAKATERALSEIGDAVPRSGRPSRWWEWLGWMSAVARASRRAVKEVERAARSAAHSVGQAAQRAVKEAQDAVAKATEWAAKSAVDTVGQAARRTVAETQDAVAKAVERAAKEAEERAERAAAEATTSAASAKASEEKASLAAARAEAAAHGLRRNGGGKKPTDGKWPQVKGGAWALAVIVALLLAAWAIQGLRHSPTHRVNGVTELLVTIAADSSDIAAVDIDASIAQILRGDSVPRATCERVKPESPPPVEDSTVLRLSVLDYLARHRFPAMGLCSTTRSVVRRSELFGVLRVDKVTDLVAWTDNENADSTIVLAVSYDALPARTATKADLWPLGVSLLLADSLLGADGGPKKNLVMTITNIHEWRRLRASARNRSVIDKGHDNYVVKLNHDIIRAPFLPLVPPERPQLTIGLLGPANLAYPDSLAEARLLGVSPLDVAILPMDTAGARTRGVLRIPERHPSDCCANDQLLAAAHDLLALPQAEPNGGSSSARARLDWLDGGFTLMRVQSVSRRNQVDRWLPNIMWGLSIAFTSLLLALGIVTIRRTLRTRIEYTQRTVGRIREQVQICDRRIDELDQANHASQTKEAVSKKRIGELWAELRKRTTWWSYPLKLIGFIGYSTMYGYRWLRGRRLVSRLTRFQDTKAKLRADQTVMERKLREYETAGWESAMPIDPWALIAEAVRSGRWGFVFLAGTTLAAIATMVGTHAGDRGGVWWTVAIAIALLWVLPGVVSPLVGQRRREGFSPLAAFALGVVAFMYLYLSWLEGDSSGTGVGQWTFNEALINLMIVGTGVAFAVGQFWMRGDGGRIGNDEAKIIERTLGVQVSDTSGVGGKRRIGLAIVYVLHLILLFGTEAVGLLGEESIVGSERSLADAVPIGTVTFVAMALPVALLFAGGGRGSDRRAKLLGRQSAREEKE